MTERTLKEKFLLDKYANKISKIINRKGATKFFIIKKFMLEYDKERDKLRRKEK